MGFNYFFICRVSVVYQINFNYKTPLSSESFMSILRTCGYELGFNWSVWLGDVLQQQTDGVFGEEYLKIEENAISIKMLKSWTLRCSKPFFMFAEPADTTKTSPIPEEHWFTRQKTVCLTWQLKRVKHLGAA